VEIDSKEARDHFLIHIKYLDIQEAKLTKHGREIDLMEYKPNEFLVFRTGKVVEPGNYVMHLGKKKFVLFEL
jgi:hypothetical protein